MSIVRELILRAEYGFDPIARHRFAMQHALAIPDGIIYSYIPKNACTSLRYAAGRQNGFVCDTLSLENIQACIQASLSEVREAKYTFVVLRCPYRRLVSTFFDKALNEPWRFKYIKKPLMKHFDTKLANLTFRRFVQMLRKRGSLMAEHHWAPQSAFLLFHNYDDYFSVKRIDDAFSVLNKRFPVLDTRDIVRHDTSKLKPIEGAFYDVPVKELRRLKSSGMVPNYRSMYDEGVKDVFDTLYSRDINLFREVIGETMFG